MPQRTKEPRGTGTPERLRVASVQMRFADSIDANLSRIEALAEQATRRRADVVLFPECAVTGYAFDFLSLRAKQVHDALEAIGSIAARLRTNLLVGAPIFRRRKLFNCLVAFDREGAITYCYAKNHLTPSDKAMFSPGNAIALFPIDGVPVTTVICHERRYPELVRLAVMAGAKILFHPNAGMDALAVSRKKRDGRDGVVTRAFENAIYYVFSNSVGPQGGGKWSAGDSKIIGPDERVLAIADNSNEAVVVANVDLTKATGTYAHRGVQRPQFLAPYWREMVRTVRQRAKDAALDFDLPNGV